MIACHYYGPGVNLAFLVYALLGPALLLVSSSGQLVGQALMQYRGLTLALGGTVILILVHQLCFTISAESGLPAALVLGTVPLFMLLGMSEHNGRVLAGYTCLVFLFAAVSVYESVVSGTRAHLPFADPNNYVTLIYLAWLPFVHERLGSEQPSTGYAPVVLFVVSLVFCVAILATSSRFGWLVIAGAACYWGLQGILQRVNWRLYSITVTAMLLAVIVHFLPATGNGTDVVAAEIGALAADQPSHRWLLIEAAWQLASEHGWMTGTGLYSFSLLYPGVRSLQEQNTAGIFVHNDYLQVFQEGGLLLSLPLIALVGVVVVRLVRQVFTRGSWQPRLGYLVAAGVALIHANLNFVFYILPLAMMLGFVLGRGLAVESTRGAESSPDNKVRAAAVAFPAVLMVALISVAVDAFSLGVLSGQKAMPGVASVRDDANTALSYTEGVLAIKPDRGLVAFGRVKLLQATLGSEDGYSVAASAKIDEAYRQALSVDPWNPGVYVDYHDFLLRQGEATLQRRTELLQRAADLVPYDVDIAVRAMATYHAAGQPSRAIEVAAGILQWCELLARRNPMALDRLGLYVSRQSAFRDTPVVQNRLVACRKWRGRSTSAKRSTTRLLEWLRQRPLPPPQP